MKEIYDYIKNKIISLWNKAQEINHYDEFLRICDKIEAYEDILYFIRDVIKNEEIK